MASYITIEELKTLVPPHVMMELSDDAVTGQVAPELINTLITEACEEVDGYLRGRYSLPFASTPTLVKRCAKQIARYMLYERRPEGFDLPDAVVAGRKIAIKNLQQIRDGLISLGISQTGQMIGDDGEFAVRVRPSRSSNSGGSSFGAAIDQW